MPSCHPPLSPFPLYPLSWKQEELPLPCASLLSCSPSPSGEHGHLPNLLIRKKIPSKNRLTSCKCVLKEGNPKAARLTARCGLSPALFATRITPRPSYSAPAVLHVLFFSAALFCSIFEIICTGLLPGPRWAAVPKIGDLRL